MEYTELLKDARWLKKKTKILKRDKYTCTACGSRTNLQVHHTYYLQSCPPPWDYPDESLLTLCYTCHHTYHSEHEHVILDKHLSYKFKPKKKDNRKKGRTNLKQDRSKRGKPRTLAQKVEDLKMKKKRNSITRFSKSIRNYNGKY